MRFSGKARGAFTLVELIISIAIIAIISTIVFVSFADERERNAVKRAAENLQISIQAAQNSAQSGLLIGGVQPTRYGIALGLNAGAYVAYADTTAPDFIFNTGDILIQQYNFDQDVEIAFLGIDNPPLPSYVTTQLDITFSVPNAVPNVRSTPSAVDATNLGTIILRQPKADLCYSITVQPSSGTVSNRQSQSCP